VPAVGASNLGHIILYGILNQQQGLLCDRAYYPADDMQVWWGVWRLKTSLLLFSIGPPAWIG
jgi:hypothetical protein